MKKHVNIPIFIPHLGCPNQCVFCNQRTISGVEKFNIIDVKEQIDIALSTVDNEQEAEIAFFGGSFTGIDRDLMENLLSLAYGYVIDGRVSSIRCSTRPDYVNEEILEILKRYSVKTIELGLQSSDDNVLYSVKRGHTYADELRACRLIKEYGFELVGQMMIGLPGATPQNEIATAEFIVKCGADGARIYPTIVFKETELYQMSLDGVYTPLDIDSAVQRSANVLKVFISSGIDVIRIGLCSSENLSDDSKYYAGPNHPAIGELIASEVYLDLIVQGIEKNKARKHNVLRVYVSKGELSKAIGQKKRNKNMIIQNYGYLDVIYEEDSTLQKYEVKTEEREKECI